MSVHRMQLSISANEQSSAEVSRELVQQYLNYTGNFKLPVHNYNFLEKHLFMLPKYSIINPDSSTSTARI